jgi:hypothetical protein
MTTINRGRRLAAALGAVLAIGSIPTAAAAAPSDNGCNNRTLNTTDKLLACVDADDALVHE